MALGISLAFVVAAIAGEPPSAAVELDVRIAEVEADVAALSAEYGDRHPALVEARERLAALSKVSARLPPRTPASRKAVGERLALLALASRAELAALAIEYGPEHPRMQAAARRRDVLARLLAATGVTESAVTPPAAGREELLVGLAKAKGRLAFVERRYLERHPRVVAARAAVEATQRALAAAGGADSVSRAAARQHFAAEIVATRLLRAHLAPVDAEATAEADAVLDALAIAASSLGL